MGQSATKPKRSGGPRRVLILGCEEAGKTCLIQQAKHHSRFEYSGNELASYRNHIRRCIIKTVQTTIKNVDKNLLRLTSEKFKYYRILEEYEFDDELTPEMVIESIEQIIENNLFWEAYESLRNTFRFEFYVVKIRAIFSSTYIPPLEDIINCYKPTRDMHETMLGSDAEVKIVEIAGSRYARRRWIQTLEKFETVVFVASSLHYEYGPDFEESVTFFETICNSRLFSHCKIHLVFTKIDLLREELTQNGADFRCTMDEICTKYFEVAEKTTPFYEVDLMSEKSSGMLIKSLLNL
jgi:GTPase SAR1 family protein